MQANEILSHFGLTHAGDHPVHSPIDGAEICLLYTSRCV